MLLPVIVFLGVAAMIVGTYLALTMGPGLVQRRRLDRRLREIAAPAAGSGAAPADSVIRRSDEALLDRVASSTRPGTWLARLASQAGVPQTPGRILLMCVAMAVGCGLLAGLLLRQFWAPPAAALAGAWLPVAWLMHRRTARFKRFEELFPEALELLSRAVKAGHSFQAAMNMVAEEIADPIGPEFKISFDQQNFGLPLRDALNQLAERVPIIDVRFFVTAVLIQRETGGNLSEILDNLAHVVRERFKVLRQVRVHTAHGRFTAWVLLALPASLAVVLSYLNPDHMQLLFREPMGHALLIAAVVMQTIGFFWIRQVIKIEV
jgi:tight adherence protein B